MNDRTVTTLEINSETSGAADYERAMAGAEAATRRSSDAANDFTINLLAVGTGAVAAALAIKQGIDKIVDANKGLAQMAALAERVGLSLKDLQGVQFGGRVAGLADDQINAGLERSASLLNDAQRNVNSLSKLFEENGVKIRNANGQLISQNQLLQASADLVKRAQSPQDAIVIAQMLGYTKEWVPLLRQGGDAMRGLGDEAEKAGALINDETVQRAKQFDEEWRKSSVTFNTRIKAALLDLLPYMDDLLDKASEFSRSVKDFSVDSLVHAGARSILKSAGIDPDTVHKIEPSPEAVAAWDRIASRVSQIWSDLKGISGDPAIQEIIEEPRSTPLLVYSRESRYPESQDPMQASSYPRPRRSYSPYAPPPASDDPAMIPGRNVANDAVDRAINSLRKHTEQQLADAAAMGQGVRVQAEFRAEAQRLAAVQANGGKITAEQAAAFEKLKTQAGDAAVALERNRINQDIKFGRETALLSPQDVQIAQQLKGLYPDVATALNSAEAAQLRYNATLKDLSSQFGQAAVSNLTDFEMGLKSGSDAVCDFEKQFLRSTLNMINQWLVFKAIGGFGFGGGSITSLFGSAHGNAFSAGAVVPFAQGGVIDRPMIAPMALMGEAGPEAVMPLRRDSRGNLGVAGGGHSTNITYQIDASGADSGTVQRIAQVLDQHGKAIAAQGKAMTTQARFAQTGVM